MIAPIDHIACPADLARLREAGLVHPARVGSDTRRRYYERDAAACQAALVCLREILG